MRTLKNKTSQNKTNSQEHKFTHKDKVHSSLLHKKVLTNSHAFLQTNINPHKQSPITRKQITKSAYKTNQIEEKRDENRRFKV